MLILFSSVIYHWIWCCKHIVVCWKPMSPEGISQISSLNDAAVYQHKSVHPGWCWRAAHCGSLWPQGPFYEHVLTLNPSMDISIFPEYIMAWNYLSIPNSFIVGRLKFGNVYIMSPNTSLSMLILHFVGIIVNLWYWRGYWMQQCQMPNISVICNVMFGVMFPQYNTC